MKLIHIIPTLLLISVISCDSSSKQEEKSAPPKQKKYDQPDIVYDVINATLKQLIPSRAIQITQATINYSSKNKSKDLNMTIFLNDRLLVASKENIQLFIDQGGSDLLWKINRESVEPVTINISRIRGFNKVEFPITYPLTKSEVDHQIGGINYSRIAFNKDKTKAAFIFDFIKSRDKLSSTFCAVEVIRKNKKWVILSKIFIHKSPSMMLYE